MPYKSGWVPDVPDIRDWLYSQSFKIAAELAPKTQVRKWWPPSEWFKKPDTSLKDVDLGDLAPPPYDQSSLGSCVENATAVMLGYLENKEGYGIELLSRLFMYYNVRGGVPQDTGSSLRACIKSVAKVGVCKEELWKYDLGQWQFKPSPQAFNEADHRKNICYARLVTLEDMQHCLMSGYPFVFGMSIYEPFEMLSGKDCTLPMPKGTDAWKGAHGQCAIGMSVKRQAFRVRNSWSKNWGDNGDYWLPWSYVSSPMLADDFWTVRKIAQ